jgi:protein SCO1/2
MISSREGLTLTALAVAIVGLPMAVFAQDGADHAAHSATAATNHDAIDDTNFHGIDIAFELLDRDGTLVSAEDFRGRYVLLGFGFTHCAHICPMMVLNMGKALKMTDVDAAGIFISVDTERDTPAVTDAYASNFGDAMMGLGGSYEQVSAAAENFKASFAVTKTQANYTVQHTANVYVIDPEGELVDIYTFSTPAETLQAAMQ